MRYLDFKNNLEDHMVFSLRDIQSFEPDFNLVQLSQWQRKEYIKKIIKGRYVFSDVKINEEILFLISNELLSPSYISLESALSWYGIIPEGVYGITAVSTVRTVEYTTGIANFSYRTLKPSAFFGDQLCQIQGQEREYRLASIEKALVDYFYFHDDINAVEAIEELRLNPEIMKNDVNYETLMNYTKLMQNKELTKRMNILIKHYNND